MTSYKMQRFNGKNKKWEDISVTVDGISADSLSRYFLELREIIENLEAIIDMQRIKMLHMANAVANQLPDRDKFFSDFLGPDDNFPSEPPLP